MHGALPRVRQGPVVVSTLADVGL